MEEIESDYVNCPKCGVLHSTLVRHKCFVEDEAPPMPESKGGPDDFDGGGEDKQQGEGDGEDESQSEGDGEGEGDGEEEREAPAPQAPEPEAPPVAVVVTVLKFAALTADCAKNGNIEVTLTADGLFIYGHNGDDTATALIPWTEFEKRSTIDGEFHVKSAIDEVDRAMADKDSDEYKLSVLMAEAKAKRDAKAEAKAKGEVPEEEAEPKKRGKRKAA